MLQKRTLLVAALAASLASSASATLIAYEGFNSYSSGALTGGSGGTGWLGNWATGGTSMNVAAGFSGAPGDQAAFDDSSAARTNVRQWRDPATDLADGTVIWASVQVRHTAGTDAMFSLFQQSGQTGSAFGIATTTSDAGTGNFRIGVRDTGTSVYAANGTTVTGAATAVSTATPATVYLKYTLSTTALNDRLDVYVNPLTDPGVNPGSISITTRTFYVTSLGGQQGTGNLIMTGFSSGLVGFDEIRIGTTFADVSAIPEPSSFAALAGLGVLGLVASRRRRQA
jgi:hypothetical protein